MMRDISEITSDLQKTASELGAKRKAHNDATVAAQKTFQELDAVQVKVGTLRNELNEALNVLVPQSVQQNVRQS